MSFYLGGAAQTNFRVTDALPANTTFTWQGGGTSNGQTFSGGTLSWFENNPPAGWGGYVDFAARVNSNVPIGTWIENTAQATSGQVPTVTSNTVRNQVGPLNPDMNYLCSADGTSATVSWGSAGAGAVYYPRVWTSDGICPDSSWTLWTNGQTCYKDGTTATSFNLTNAAGKQYAAWVYAGDPIDTDLVPGATGSFVCAPKPVVSASCPAPGTSASIRWDTAPVPGATKYNIIVNIGAASCPSGWGPTLSWSPGNNYCQKFTTDANTLSTTFAPTTPGATYSTAVSAFFGDIGGEYSNEPSFTCLTTTSATLPDLTASNVTATALPSISPTTYSLGTTISNVHATSTGRNFYNFFQSATDANGSNPTYLFTTAPIGPLAGNTSLAVSRGYTFSGPGTYYLRACADKSNATDAGLVNEGSPTSLEENNNCSPGWTQLTIPNTALHGSFGAASCTTIGGWAFSSTSPSTSINVKLYDGLASTGTYIGTFPANVSRPDVNAAYGITGNHGFSFATPASLKDGVAHNLYVYPVETNGVMGPTPLGGSPKSLTCPAPSLPDLTASNTSPTTATAGVETNLSATIFNANITTGVGFIDLFQIDTDTDHTSGVTERTDSSPILSPGGTDPVSTLYIFPSDGDYYVRVCADKSTAADATGVVNEGTPASLEENNNCSLVWTRVNVGSSSGPTCSPLVSSVSPGSSVTLTAFGGSGGPYEWRAFIGDGWLFTGTTYTTTYSADKTVYVEDSANVRSPNCSVTVGSPCNTLVTDIRAVPDRFVASSGETTVSWSASGVTGSCIITKNNTQFVPPISPVSCSIPTQPGTLDTVTEQTQYCITCNNDLTKKKCVTVNVGSEFDEF
jgi:hypothetical protein